ncbi:hypothetical protein K474DRAFT_1667763 [Panus rudis PR-1116 ss-1]|nr:hypothetical protein K474DRAFT_1667763 [Panus rudis PR-1116 ss-1]
MIATVNPPYFYGPFAPEYRNDEATISGLSTNGYLYQLINPTGPAPPVAANIDVRDVAKALVAALKAPTTSQVGRKRIPLSGEWFSGKEAIEYLAKVRPQLKDRLSKVAVNDAGLARVCPTCH